MAGWLKNKVIKRRVDEALLTLRVADAWSGLLALPRLRTEPVDDSWGSPEAQLVASSTDSARVLSFRKILEGLFVDARFVLDTEIEPPAAGKEKKKYIGSN